MRFFYHSKSKKYINIDNEEHAIYFHNKKMNIKNFDLYIRGIIENGVLYLRLFYDKPDISERTLEEVKEYSFNILFDNKQGILNALKNDKIKVKKVLYNIVNADIKGILVNL